jgi:hypothetical protein
MIDKGGKKFAGLAAILFLFAGVPANADDGIPLGYKIDPIALPDLLSGEANLGPLIFRGSISITTPDPDFVGWSGMWVSPDGKEMVGVEDGRWVKARLDYDDGGNLSGFTLTATGELHDAAGNTFTDDEDRDVEALDHDGKAFLAGFETHDRVLRYTDIDGPGTSLPIPPSVLTLIHKGARFSSVVALGVGSALMIPEYSYADAQSKEARKAGPAPHQGWMQSRKGAGPIALRGASPALPVSMARLPSGDVLTSEVRFNAATKHFDQSAIGIVSKDQIKPGGTMHPRWIALFAAPLSAWIDASSARKGPKGETLIYLISSSKPPILYMFELRDGWSR